MREKKATDDSRAKKIKNPSGLTLRRQCRIVYVSIGIAAVRYGDGTLQDATDEVTPLSSCWVTIGNSGNTASSSEEAER